MTKIIFLDFDGVLNSARTIIAYGQGMLLPRSRFDDPKFDPVALSLVRALAEDTDAKIVVSSTWRTGATLEELQRIFELYNWDTRGTIIDMTPSYMNVRRGLEINSWLDSNSWSNYVILDDGTGFLDEQLPHLIKTDMYEGFQFRDFIKAGKLLGPGANAKYFPLDLDKYLV